MIKQLLQYKWSNKVTYGSSESHGAVAQLDDTGVGSGTFAPCACGKQQQPASKCSRKTISELTALIYTLRTLESQRALLELHLIYGSLLVMTTSKFESIADHAVASELQLIQCSAP